MWNTKYLPGIEHLYCRVVAAGYKVVHGLEHTRLDIQNICKKKTYSKLQNLILVFVHRVQMTQKYFLVYKDWHTICPRSSYPFHILTYYIKWVTTSGTCCTVYNAT